MTIQVILSQNQTKPLNRAGPLPMLDNHSQIMSKFMLDTEFVMTSDQCRLFLFSV